MSSVRNNERRWILRSRMVSHPEKTMAYPTTWVDGPDLRPGEMVEVMPVAEHKAEMELLTSALKAVIEANDFVSGALGDIQAIAGQEAHEAAKRALGLSS